MADLTHPGAPRWSALRKLPWIVAALLLLLPALAMRLGVDGVVWTASDFVVMGIILLIACGSFELIARHAPDVFYLVAAAIGVGTGFLLVWANLAVGIIGDGLGPANLMFFGVVLVAIVGAGLARGRASGMAKAMGAAAVVLVLAVLVGLTAFGATVREAMLTLVFVLAWLGSAGLFMRSARGSG
jgi:hypothetical protein